jgi:5-formyltetrahydrofolate cyclo-ligase
LGIPEHEGELLGPAALEGCDLLFLPAVAVDHAGHRLGRGAGYYDRALADVRAPLCALVFTHELLPEIPHEPHDVPVQMAVTPDGLFRVP